MEDLRQALNLNKIKQALRSCFEFLQKVFLGLMYLFSCVLWAIFWSFSLLDKFKTASKLKKLTLCRQQAMVLFVSLKMMNL